MIPSASAPKHVSIDEVLEFNKQIRDKNRKLRAERNNSLDIKCALCGNQILGGDLRVGPYNVYIHPSAARMLSRWCRDYPDINQKRLDTLGSIGKGKETTEKYGELARRTFLEIEKDVLTRTGNVAAIPLIQNGDHCGGEQSKLKKIKRTRQVRPLPIALQKQNLTATLHHPVVSLEPEIPQEWIEDAKRRDAKQAKLTHEIPTAHPMPQPIAHSETEPAQDNDLHLLAILSSRFTKVNSTQ